MEGSELIDEELESLFNEQLTNMNHSTMTEMEPRERLRKTKVPIELQEKADSIFGHYLRGVDTKPEITDKVHVMGKAVEIKMGLPQNVSSRNGRQKPSNGNRRVRKIKIKMKVLRQSIARTGNELKTEKKSNRKRENKKKILKDLKQQMEESDTTSKNIRRYVYRQKWLDQL